MDEFSHSQVYEIKSNSSGNILDLVFFNTLDILPKISEVPHVFSTDHTVLIFLLTLLLNQCIRKQNVQYIITKLLAEVYLKHILLKMTYATL